MTAADPRPSRRDVLTTIGAVASVLTLPASAHASGADHPVIVRGFVWNADSSPTNDRVPFCGIPGVMISNSRDVVLTAQDGSWEIAATPGDSIFVIKPPHWSYPHRSGVPDVHRPFEVRLNETLARRLKSATSFVEPINFFLRQSPEPEDFEVLLVADTQAANATELEYVRAEIDRHIDGTTARFVIHHGDVMGDDLSLLSEHREIVEQTGIPWHHCPGNHDMDLAATNSRHAFETWKRVIGPTHYAFQCAGATFIILNNVEYFGKGAEPKDGRLYRGLIGNDQLAFVENVLRHVDENELVVLSMHIPLDSFENPESEADTTADRDRLLALLARHPHTVSFSGHSHTTEHHYLDRRLSSGQLARHHHQVLTAFCGSWWSGPTDAHGIPRADSRDGTPRGFHVLQISGNSYQTQFVPMTSTPHPQMRVQVETKDPLVTFGQQSAKAETAELQIIVNVFDGGPHTRVVCEMPHEGEMRCITLERSRLPDPFIVKYFEDNKPLLKPWVTASPSSHIWRATIPAGMTASRETLKVRVNAEHGEPDEVLLDLPDHT